jgi:phosphoribosylaminoimidazolecarboxamide formyltransferase/IMP cyclohydrolase
MIKVKRALISVSDKSGLLEFVRGLQRLGIEILSTGGTARALHSGGIPVVEVGEYTGFPEILDGRVKTLHPAIHGGLLAVRDNPSHLAQLQEHHIGLIDMVVANLYPFRKVIQKKNVSLEEALENIDIGGPTLLRAAAKNFKNVAVVCNPQRYQDVLKELDVNSGILADSVLRKLAVEAFSHTSSYDQIIFDYLNSRLQTSDFSGMPRSLHLSLIKKQDLRYGENPHQAAALYGREGDAAGLTRLCQFNGKALSFNNYLDLNAAVNMVKEFSKPAAAIIKHNNPTGVAEDETLTKAYQQAWRCDPAAAFGGIIGFNQKVNFDTAQMVDKSGFMECVIAPDYHPQARELLCRKKNFRVIQLKMNDLADEPYEVKDINGCFLLQECDNKIVEESDLKVVTKRKPTAVQIEAMLFGWKVTRHIRSNAVILVKGRRTIGIGCGLTSRVESTALAIKKAGVQAKNAILVSEAFIPKTDNIELAAQAGIKVIIQTGGSLADADVIAAADKAGMAMVMTGIRHFKH